MTDNLRLPEWVPEDKQREALELIQQKKRRVQRLAKRLMITGLVFSVLIYTFKPVFNPQLVNLPTPASVIGQVAQSSPLGSFTAAEAWVIGFYVLLLSFGLCSVLGIVLYAKTPSPSIHPEEVLEH